VLSVEKISLKLGKKQILEKFSCTFEPGVHGLLGPNGAGKTTLMRCILGLYPKYKGEIILGDSSKDQLNVGYLPQKFSLFPGMTVREVLRYIGRTKEIDKDFLEENIEQVVEGVNLTEMIDRKTSSLSGGMLRRVGIAQAVLGNPDIVIFDEPTAGLDPEERLRFKNFVRENKEKHTIIISTHIVDDVDYLCDFVEILDSGKLKKKGSASEIKDYAKDKVYGVSEAKLQKYSIAEEDYYLEKEYEKDGENYFRILSGKKLPFTTLQPELEDGYISVLRGI
jgi:ABC-2 type transport system ATP-binding protein